MLSKILAFAAVLCACLLATNVIAMNKFSERTHAHMLRSEKEAAKRGTFERAAPAPGCRYYTNETAPYYVESLPEVNLDLGELYAGNVPIDMDDPSRTLFYMFKPRIGAPVDEVTIWLNGGPGCSSLEGFFQENGPVLWQPGTYSPQANPYSWANLTNMLWVEQPVGTGFATGKPTATTQEETAEDFVKFFKNFQQIFGIKNYKIYVTGESYAGRYVPYISAAMLDQKDKEYFDLSGAIAYDPCIGSFVYTAEEAVAVPYAKAYNNVLNLNQTFMNKLEGLHKSCGYEEYVDKYLTFPPPGEQPAKYFNYTSEAKCDVFDMIDNAALEMNPCFDIYDVNAQCPLLWDVLGFPTQLVYDAPGSGTTYFNRTDVKKAIHAPLDVEWAECKGPVFVGNGGPQGEGDLSADPIQHVLPQVIEATNRVLVGNGDLDMIIITNGTLLSIQNMTWNGKLGFQEEPKTPINVHITDLQYASVFKENGYAGVDGPQGIVGTQHYERGLMWSTSTLAGHMEPEFQPRKTYRDLQWVLGRINVL